MFVKLSEGRRVKDPQTGKALDSNREYKVKRTQFWLKRLAEQDIFESIEEKKIEDVKSDKKLKQKKEKGE